MLPDVSTTFSNTEFKIAEPSDNLKGKAFGTYTNNEAAFDNILTNNPGTSTAPCAIGTEFKVGHVGLISQVKWFMGDIAGGDTTYLAGNLKF